MFARKLGVYRINADDEESPCPQRWLDSFSMRNFTNDAVFDDTLPVADGLMEIGAKVSVEELQRAMEKWFRGKSWLYGCEQLVVRELPAESDVIRSSAEG